MKKNERLELSFTTRMVKIGIITVSAAIIANFLPAIYLWVVYGIAPSIPNILKIWSVAAAAYAVSWIVQPVAYFGILGICGTYIAFTVGSVADIRLPAIVMAQKAAGVEPGTPEGDIISAMGVSSSTFVSIILITVFTFAGVKIIPYLPVFIETSFKYILPSIFGAVYMLFTQKKPNLGIAVIILAILITFVGKNIGIAGWLLTILIVFTGMLVARIIYKFEKEK